MMALLRADWLRLRRRRDLWVIFVLVLLIGGIGFIAGYRTDVQDPPPFDRAQAEQDLEQSGYFEGMSQEEIDAARPQLLADQQAQAEADLAARNDEQLISLQKYEFPQSILAMIGLGIAPIVALVLIATLVIGDEFRFGTVRTSLLAAGNRRRFLVSRLISLVAMTVGLYVALALLAVVLSFVLVVIGAELPPATMPLHPGPALALVGTEILSATVLIALAAALTVLLRSGALPLLIVVLGLLLETFIAALPVFWPGKLLSGVPQFFLTNAGRTLLARIGNATGAIGMTGQEVPPAPIDLALPFVVAIVVAWGLLFLVIADRRIRTMDVTE
ncbi:MAG TPA: ABC transporter permease subunit [Verrucomicrobiae bacterium]|nr:ABC transporter permease subunit [Verrucomicrobiae bacterium]